MASTSHEYDGRHRQSGRPEVVPRKRHAAEQRGRDSDEQSRRCTGRAAASQPGRAPERPGRGLPLRATTAAPWSSGCSPRPRRRLEQRKPGLRPADTPCRSPRTGSIHRGRSRRNAGTEGYRRRSPSPQAARSVPPRRSRRQAGRRGRHRRYVAECQWRRLSGVASIGRGIYTRAMAPPTRRGFVAGALSMLFPGAGQLYTGAFRRGFILIAITLAGMLLLALGLSWLSLDQLGPVDRRLVAAALAVNLAVLGFRLFAVADARVAAPSDPRRARDADRRTACRGRLDDRSRLRRARGGLRGRGTCRRHRQGTLPRAAAAALGRDKTAGRSRSSSGSDRARWRRSRRTCECSRTRRPPRHEAVDDDPPARHRRRPGELGRADRHDHPRGDPARDRPRGRVRGPAQPRPGTARTKGTTLEGAAERSLRPLGRRPARVRARSSRRSRTCSASGSTTTRSSTCSASPTSSTRSAASRSRSRSGSSTR